MTVTDKQTILWSNYRSACTSARVDECSKGESCPLPASSGGDKACHNSTDVNKVDNSKVIPVKLTILELTIIKLTTKLTVNLTVLNLILAKAIPLELHLKEIALIASRIMLVKSLKLKK